MKIEYTTKLDFPHEKMGMLYQFTIKQSILITHFKSLMKLARLYESSKKTGCIHPDDKEEFLSLIDKIEKSSDARCKKSHEAATKNFKEKTYSSSRCEHEDLGSLGYRHGDTVTCPFCGKRAEVW